MKHLLQNALFVGGVLPMIIFGIFNFIYKPISLKLPTMVLLFSISFGGFVTLLLLNAFQAESVVSWGKTAFSWEVLGGVFLGFLWALGVYTMALGLGKLGGNASQIIPIINVNTLITVVLVLIFMPEPVNALKVLLGTLFILLGSFLLI